jgi:superfamily II DNA or RNA helicase
MSERRSRESSAAGGWTTANVWADAKSVDGNPIRQLLVPKSTFSDLVPHSSAPLGVENNFGTWPSFSAGTSAPAELALQVASGSAAGGAVRSGTWTGPRARSTPATVTESFTDALSFSEGAAGGAPGLRSPQLGAVHAVLGYWTTGPRTPATVVMPTGTGKTETMLALLVAAKIPRLLVLVPTDALRLQVSAKFEHLGVLQELGIVSRRAIRPVVGRVEHAFSDTAAAGEFAEACNVIVATPQVLSACSKEVLEALLEGCTHLFVDEAHHVAAATWSDVRNQFAEKAVVQFTATPFREDGRHLSGQLVYAFPLRMAQEQGFFSRINYTSVIDFSNLDRAVATQALDQLRSDLAAGHDHMLMARVDGIPRAKALLPLYQELAGDLNPVIINSQMSKKHQTAALEAMGDRTSRVILCVNMLGEGFDLPALKIAAVHDPKKSLGVTLQFIGRFARTTSEAQLGDASVFVARRDVAVDKQLRTLYAENSDWNVVLSDLTAAAVGEQQEVSDFEAGFTSEPEGVNLRSLLPKMSTVVYQTPSNEWDPQALVDHFGEENLLTMPIGLNEEAGVAWCVVEHRDRVRWGDVKTVEEIVYELFVVYFDRERRLLYINSSENSGVFEELTEAIVGAGAVRYTGSTVYRVMADIKRLTPTTVGVLDIHSQFRRFSMHVGSDVTEGFSTSEARTKTQTNISGHGYRDGDRVNISASLKGRIWTYAAATSLRQWCKWCDGIGSKLLDDSISIDDIIGNFLVPQEVTSRPIAVLLGVEWPWDIYMQGADRHRLQLGDKTYAMVDVALVPADAADSGPFKFVVTTGAWTVPYEADYVSGRLTFRCGASAELEIVASNGSTAPLSGWLNDFGLTLLLDGDRLIDTNGLLYAHDEERDPYPRDRLWPLDWTGVDLRVESQGPNRLANSIQAHALTTLLNDSEWDVVLDDDGSGEMADLVALKLDETGLRVKLVHCKFSHDSTPGARVIDLYEVCGQASKSAAWRTAELEPFFRQLDRRARRKQERTGFSPFMVGDESTFYRLREEAPLQRRRMEVVVVQPGLSAAAASDAQLELLASTEAYLRNRANAPLEVWCSA